MWSLVARMWCRVVWHLVVGCQFTMHIRRCRLVTQIQIYYYYKSSRNVWFYFWYHLFLIINTRFNPCDNSWWVTETPNPTKKNVLKAEIIYAYLICCSPTIVQNSSYVNGCLITLTLTPLTPIPHHLTYLSPPSLPHCPSHHHKFTIFLMRKWLTHANSKTNRIEAVDSLKKIETTAKNIVDVQQVKRLKRSFCKTLVENLWIPLLQQMIQLWSYHLWLSLLRTLSD